MKSLFDDDGAEETRSDADLTLGMGSLLSIFFGVVLICGIFFGFGYSMGRRNARATAPSAVTLPPAVGTSSPLPDNDLSKTPPKPQQPDSTAPVPSPDDTSPSENRSAESKSSDASKASTEPSSTKHAAEDEAETQKPAKTSAPPSPSAKNTRVVQSATADPSLNAVPYSHRAPLPSKPHAGVMAPLAQAPGDSPIIPGHPIMVQIAAVSRQEDAEVLAGALRKRGFSPTVRSGTGDKFYHVQVGPFTDKNQAETIKQHLLADGYNAIVK
jgi:cell division protein FtsN